MVVCLVQRFPEELKQSIFLNVTSDIFRLENYCLQLIIMGDYMQLLLPKWPIMWEISVSKLKLRRLANSKNCCCLV